VITLGPGVITLEAGVITLGPGVILITITGYTDYAAATTAESPFPQITQINADFSGDSILFNLWKSA
jgi:hypothetical protein